MNYDIIVVGSGPGGYVAAIRASQLGKKVAVVERAELGGICLNWGCIPTKALLKSAEVYNYAKHANDYGVKIAGEIEADFAEIVKRSRGVADGMSKGIQFLFKKNKVEIINGFGKVKPGKKVDVTNDKGETTEYSAEHIIIATGARSRELPNLPQDGEKIIGYRKAMTLDKKPESMVGLHQGELGGCCTTSGLAFKMRGRVGDSPIIGAGLYVDGEVGACSATGLGEYILKSQSSFLVVELMRQGKNPEEACKEALQRIVKKYWKNKKHSFQVGLVALNLAGEYAGYSIVPGYTYAINIDGESQIVEAPYLLEK